ncbi:MAG: DUF4173 domain-containing protein [Oscillospiraceae bacterium]|nr:DUF4173 domain-containing protein [Oscillospiraceae bacterium]
MEKEKMLPEGLEPAGLVPVPENEKKPFFSASTEEKIAAFLMLAAAYIYTYLFEGESWKLTLCVFFSLYVIICELVNRRTRPTVDSLAVFACFSATFISIELDFLSVWGDYQYLFLHVFAVWWALCRSGALLEGRNGRFIAFDAVNGFFIIPFKNFILQFRCIVAAFVGRSEEKKESAKPLAVIAAAAASAVLFIMAVSLLRDADAGFAEIVDGILGRAGYNLIDTLWRLLLSIHVGAWLFGLLAGSQRADKQRLNGFGIKIEGFIAKLRLVPSGLWVGIAAVFSALYAGFFAIQGSYLFGAFAGKLPDGFIVSEYARRGFFELLKVMALNFVLLWCLSRTGKKDPRGHRPTLAAAAVLTFESLVFAAVAASKLWLYIDSFGFTPKRLQSMWMVTVLAFGCAAFFYNTVTGKRSARAWIYYTAVSLCATCFIK